MSEMLRPFRALRPRPETASAVIAPPYDVVSVDEARELAADRPASFLHISRPEIDLEAGADPHSDAAYARGARNLATLVDDGTLVRESVPAYYVYRLRQGNHEQTGIGLVASIAAYESHAIKRHERTRPDKEQDRVRNIESLNAQTGPVLSAYRADATLDSLLAQLSAGEPLFAAEGQHGVEHSIWAVSEPALVAELARALNAIPSLYIADGHHRSAAAARVAAARREGDPQGSHQYFLSVAFSHDQLRIHDYNRVVADLNGLDSRAFLDAVAETFDVSDAGPAPKPDSPTTFAMYLDGDWRRLTPKTAVPADPVGGLDVSLLQDRLIGPLLGIDDPRTDARIDFVGGVRGLEGLEARVDSGTAAVAFALYPTQMDQLMAVADAGALMPPKSTWFEPKLADGLLTHVLD